MDVVELAIPTIAAAPDGKKRTAELAALNAATPEKLFRVWRTTRSIAQFDCENDPQTKALMESITQQVGEHLWKTMQPRSVVTTVCGSATVKALKALKSAKYTGNESDATGAALFMHIKGLWTVK